MSNASTTDPTALRRALAAIQDLRARLDAATKARHEPIAIVGMACRFPGAARDLDGYWEVLRHGQSAITEVPANRWNVDDFYDADPDAWDGMYTRHGGFIDGIEDFDPRFFEISPREAYSMDPQQRLLLELSWQALEHAALSPFALRQSPTGVFVGLNGTNDYSFLLAKARNLSVELYAGTGNSCSVAAGRISYCFGFHGPAVSLDTACSSSMSAIHLAIQALRNGECSLALAGGVNAIIVPQGTIIACRGRMLSPEGQCKSFDASADGYVRSEGCGMLVLKRLRDAVADGDRVLAIVRGTACNQDGRSSGLTAPNGVAQAAVLRAALQDAGVQAHEVSHVEAHGTGTKLGDPIELGAVKAVYCEGRDPAAPLLVTSGKANIGHLESASGVAGLIKVVLSLQHEEIPPHRNLSTPNPAIAWDPSLQVPLVATPWRRGATPRLAGVTSFGFSGTNVHMVLEEAPPSAGQADADGAAAVPGALVTLSARSASALKVAAGRLDRHLAGHPSLSLPDVAYTLNGGRAAFEYRLATMTTSIDELRGRLRDFAATSEPSSDRVETESAARRVAGMTTGTVGPSDPPRVAFLYTGQGSQYAGMGRQLFEGHPVFRAAIEECDEALGAIGGSRLIDILYAADEARAETRLQQTGYAQPALFALQYALTRVWRSWGIEPGAVLGHSVGEFAAACTAGAMDVRDGLQLIAARARLMQALPAGGGMLAVSADETTVRTAMTAIDPQLAIAALNSVEDIVVSGDLTQLRKLQERLAVDGVGARLLNVSHAFHSPLMASMLDEFRRVASAIEHRRPMTRLMSNLTGQPLGADEVMDADYWCRHVLTPVYFGPSLAALRALKFDVFVEIGPQPVLSALGRKADASGQAAWLPSLRKGRHDWLQMLDTLGELFVRGVPFDARGAAAPARPAKVALPDYPFERTRYYPDVPAWHKRPKPDAIAMAQVPDEWMLELAWRPVSRERATADAAATTTADAAPGASRVGPAGTWVIFCDAKGIGRAIADTLRARGEQALCVVAGPAFAQTPGGDVTVRRDEPEDLELVRTLANARGQSLRGIVHLWSLDQPAVATLTAAEIAGTATVPCESVLAAMQRLIVTQAGAPPRLWVLTQGAQRLGPEAGCEVAQASVWGFARSIAMEHAEFWGGLIDVDPAGDAAATAAEVCTELLTPDVEDQIAFRGGQRYGARLARNPVRRPGADLAWHPDGTYLLTGGLGGIALEVARWMVKGGARRLILLGRSSLPPRAQWAAVDPQTREGRRIGHVRALEALGASIHLAAVDVADPSAVRAFVDGFRAEGWPPIRGVIHAAGVLHYDPVLRQTAEGLRSTVAPKAVGGWALHEALRDQPLDCFVLFSSAAALLGPPLMASYAASNAVLDALAQHRHAQGLPVTSVNWGSWSEVGMAAEYDPTAARRAEATAAMLSPAQGIAALEAFMASGAPQSGLMPAALIHQSVAQSRVGAAPLFRELAGAAAESKAAGGRRFTRADWIAAEAEQQERLREYLIERVSAVLCIDPAAFDSRTPLTSTGLDSLMALELKNRVNEDLGVAIPMVKVVEGVSVDELSELLNGMLAEAVAADTPSTAAATTPEALLERLQDMTETEMDALLERLVQQRA